MDKYKPNLTILFNFPSKLIDLEGINLNNLSDLNIIEKSLSQKGSLFIIYKSDNF